MLTRRSVEEQLRHCLLHIDRLHDRMDGSRIKVRDIATEDLKDFLREERRFLKTWYKVLDEALALDEVRWDTCSCVVRIQCCMQYSTNKEEVKW